MLSRLGASTGSFGVAKWKDVEARASDVADMSLTIVRCGAPLIGGPFYALDPDLVAKSKWKNGKGKKFGNSRGKGKWGNGKSGNKWGNSRRTWGNGGYGGGWRNGGGGWGNGGGGFVNW